jgi:hypothetical protein
LHRRASLLESPTAIVSQRKPDLRIALSLAHREVLLSETPRRGRRSRAEPSDPHRSPENPFRPWLLPSLFRTNAGALSAMVPFPSVPVGFTTMPQAYSSAVTPLWGFSSPQDQSARLKPPPESLPLWLARFPLTPRNRSFLGSLFRIIAPGSLRATRLALEPMPLTSA